jgi:hypothetical protein
MNIQQPTTNIEQPMPDGWRQFAPAIWIEQLCPIWLPLPAVLLWRSDYGRTIALGLFFVGCATCAACAFRPKRIHLMRRPEEICPQEIWNSRLVQLALALLIQWTIFSALCLVFNDAHDIVAPVLALGSLIPALTVAPCLVLTARKPFAAVVFTSFLVFSMKLIGCIVVVLVYGWDADLHGYTTLPWTHPNLLVWLFWLNTALLSFSSHLLAGKKFVAELTARPAAAAGAKPFPIAIP